MQAGSSLELPEVRKEKSSQQQMTLTLKLFLSVCAMRREADDEHKWGVDN
jgi:hypothetical protein